jgi:hypothetical protein
MRTQRQRLIFIGVCLLLLVVGYHGVTHDFWGIFGNISGGDFTPSKSRVVEIQTPRVTRGAQPALPIWAETSICGRDRLAKFLAQAESDEVARDMIFCPRNGPISRDSLDETLPSAMRFPASEGGERRIVFAIPLKAGEGKLPMFEDSESKLWTEHPDILIASNDIAYRRTDRYLFMGGTPETVLACNDGMFPQYKDPSLLAMMKGDLQILRKSPAQYQGQIAFWSKLLGSFLKPGAAERFLRTQVDSAAITFRAHGDVTAIHLSLTGRDFGKLDKDYPRPAFPASCFAQLEYCFVSRAEVKERVAELVEFFVSRNPPAPGMEEKTQQGSAILNEMLTTILGDATSIGIERTPTGVNAYAVLQYNQPRDLDATLKELSKRLRGILKTDAENIPGTRLDYDDGAFHVLRILTADKKWYYDFIQQDDKVFASFSRDDGHHVAAIAALKPTGQTMHREYVSSDLAETRRMVRLAGGNKITVGMDNFMDQYFDTGRVSITVDVKDRAMESELELPSAMAVPLLKLIP